MYVASSRPAKTDFRKRLPSTVFALGTVSLLTDISAEMITAFLPVYLLFTLQLGYAQFGLLDGIYTGATALLRLVGGGISDKFRRPKAVAATGYGLSAATKVFFPLIGASPFGIGALMAADRAGKGIRTAPRDAMISLATPEDRLGAAFGVHRSMDTFGALLGPLITFLLLAQIGMVPGPIFAVSAAFAVIGLIVLISFVRETPAKQQPKGPRPSFKAGLNLLTDKHFRRTTISAGLLGLATVSDAFVYVLVQKATNISLGFLPLLPLGTAVVFLTAAAPLGKLADRMGRWRMFLLGHGLLLGVYALLFIPDMGFVGGALAMLVSRALSSLVMMWFAGKVYDVPLRRAAVRAYAYPLWGLAITCLTYLPQFQSITASLALFAVNAVVAYAVLMRFYRPSAEVLAKLQAKLLKRRAA